jgi:hypothetical protein
MNHEHIVAIAIALEDADAAKIKNGDCSCAAQILATEVRRLQKIEAAAKKYIDLDINDKDIELTSMLAFAELKELLK